MYKSRQIADWIIHKTHGNITHSKLQKLLYYCQAWHYTIFNEVLFDEEKLNNFEKTIKNYKANLSWTKEDIVKEFFKLIPDFGHKETGKYLDGKM